MQNERYLCYICRSAFQVVLGHIQWQQAGNGVVVLALQRIPRPVYNRLTRLANDIALLRIPAVTLTSKYPSAISTYFVVVCVCVVWPYVICVQHCGLCTS